jgi:ABC-2 type transport system ATP-binding protein
MPLPNVIARAVSKSYGAISVLKDIDLELTPGSITGLVGPNGVGKTTLLRIIAGLAAPDQGTVIVCGRQVSCTIDDGDSPLGFVPDEPCLLEHLTPHELIALKGVLIGINRKRLESAIPKLLSSWDLLRHQHTLVKGLSHGMKRKLTILLTLLGSPEVLLLDEPLTGLDIFSASVLKSVLKLQAAAGRTVLVSSHVLPLVEDVCERMLILSRGIIAFDGPPKSPEGSGENLDAFVLSHAETLSNPLIVAEGMHRTLEGVR